MGEGRQRSTGSVMWCQNAPN